MSTVYTPNPANNPASYTIPSSGDEITAASVNVAFEALGDMVKYTQANHATNADLATEAATRAAADSAESAARVTAVNTLSLHVPGCRLGITNGDSYTRVPITDATGVGSIGLEYFEHQRCPLWTGTEWVSRTIQPFVTNALTLAGLTSGKLYDVFAYWTGTAVRLELSAAWTNDTTRADALCVNPSSGNWKGMITKDSDPTRLYVGTIRATAATTTEDSKAKRFVWSMYHRVRRVLLRKEAAASWTMAAGSFRQANLNAANQVEFVLGFGDATVQADVRAMASITGTNVEARTALGLDSTTTEAADSTFSGFASQGTSIPNHLFTVGGSYRGRPGYGYHKLVWLESCVNATATFYGSASPSMTSGIVGTVDG